MASQWSIKNWDADSFLQQALSDALERHAAIYACVFLPPGPDGLELLAAGYSSGGIRVFDWRQASKLWLSSRQAARHSLHWHAHPGGVYALAVAGEGPSAALISCGDDGAVRGWSVREICEVVKEQQQQQQQQQQQPQQQQRPGAGPRALFEVTVPRADPPFPITASAHPAAQAVSVDQARGAAYVGASDGGVHLYDLGRLGEGGGKRGGGGAAAGGGGGGAGPAASFAGHAAAVLGMDCCGATGQVATASEDATVRVWDARAPAPCTSAIDVWNGAPLLPSSRPDQLRCLRSPPVPCVRFDAGGGWLVAGSGNGSLSMWSLGLGALAKQLGTDGCIPQALHLLPGEILMAGSEPALRRYRFSLETLASKVDVTCDSAFALDVHGGSGTVAVAGAGGAVLLSHYGTRVGRIV